jgi:hypothetical protein
MQVGKEEVVSVTPQFALLGLVSLYATGMGEDQKYLLSYRAHFIF